VAFLLATADRRVAILTGRLSDRLGDRFGEGQVFIDVDTIEPGIDFAGEIGRAVATCKVLLAVIGPNWLTTMDERGRRRLDDPNDIVRREIEAALARDARVIPILVDGAVMPARDNLPESLAGLARRNALLIRHDSFRYDAEPLVTVIEGVLAAAPAAASVPSDPDVMTSDLVGMPLARRFRRTVNLCGRAQPPLARQLRVRPQTTFAPAKRPRRQSARTAEGFQVRSDAPDSAGAGHNAWTCWHQVGGIQPGRATAGQRRLGLHGAAVGRSAERDGVFTREFQAERNWDDQ
jgi:hypothetical protein